MSEAAPAPAPHVDPPLIVFTIPGRWADAADLAARLAATPGGYVLDGPVVRDTRTGRTYAADLLPHDDKLKDVFFLAGMGRMRKADVLAVGNHATAVRVKGFGGSAAAAVEMMRVASSLLGAGGLGVLVESSGVSHNRDDWLNLAGDRDPDGRYWAYVTLVGGKRDGDRPPEFYSCGMHALGHPDVITDVAPDPQAAWSICHQFNGFVQNHGDELNNGDPVGNEHEAQFRVRKVPCVHYPPGDLYHNPYGMWRIVRA
ncbi:MAG TPA: hypothetical protein VF796_05065 [Humisphaera sp.]